jgi:photosystem II stability/assembly factor-like uncharacterized protein
VKGHNPAAGQRPLETKAWIKNAVTLTIFALFTGLYGLAFTPDAPAASLQTPVQDGVFRPVDPGGSGGTLEFAMHPVSGVLLACSDMGRSLLRSKDGGISYEAISPEGQPTLSMLVPHPAEAGVWYSAFSSPQGQGLFRSKDDGANWTLIHSSRQMARQSAAGLVFPGSPDILIWLVKKEGLRISRDDGKTFSDFSQGLDRGSLPGPAKNLSARQLLMAVTNQGRARLFIGTRSGLFQRRLQDPAWQKAPGSPEGGISAMAFDSRQGRLWAVTQGKTLHALDLNTGRWQNVSPPADRITLLATHTARPGQIWCFSHGRTGLFTSRDLGQTWQWLTRRHLTQNRAYAGNVPRDFRHRYKFQRDYLFIHPRNPDHILLGDMYLSRDSGSTWQFSATDFHPETAGWQGRGLTLLTAYRAFWDPIDPNRVYLGFSDTGLMVSPDRGRRIVSIWNSQYPDLSALAYWSRQMINSSGSCMAFATDPDDPAIQFYGMSGKGGKNSVDGLLFKTQTNGRHWAPVLPGPDGLPSGIITDIHLLPGHGIGRRQVFVVLNTLEHGRFPLASVYRSEDSGQTFDLLADSAHSQLGFPLMNLSFCRDLPRIVYAAASSEGGKRPARQLQKSAGSHMGRGGVFRSTDQGRTWTRTGGFELDGTVQVAAHPHDPDTAFAAVVQGRAASKAEAFVRRGGIYRTTDGGTSWQLVLGSDNFFPGQETPPGVTATAVAINPAAPDILYASVNRAGVFRSLDAGDTWMPVAWDQLRRFQGNYHTLTINPHDPAEFFLALFGNSFLAYRDPVASRAMGKASAPLIENSGFDLGLDTDRPVHWQWQNLGHPGPEDPPILSIQKAPLRQGQALRVQISKNQFSHPDLTGSRNGPITFMSQRLTPWAMAAVRGRQVRLRMDMLVHRLKTRDTPLLTVTRSGDLPDYPIAELPAALYNSEEMGKWQTLYTDFMVPPDTQSLVITLLATEKDKRTDLFIDNITLTVIGGLHGS